MIIFGRKPYFYDIPTLFLNVEKNINKHAFLQKDEKISIINEHIKNESKKNYFTISKLKFILLKFVKNIDNFFFRSSKFSSFQK